MSTKQPCKSFVEATKTRRKAVYFVTDTFSVEFLWFPSPDQGTVYITQIRDGEEHQVRMTSISDNVGVELVERVKEWNLKI